MQFAFLSDTQRNRKFTHVFFAFHAENKTTCRYKMPETMLVLGKKQTKKVLRRHDDFQNPHDVWSKTSCRVVSYVVSFIFFLPFVPSFSLLCSKFIQVFVKIFYCFLFC